MTGIILAGGKSSRMNGEDKAFLKIGKETLINRQLRLLKKLFRKIIVVTNSPQKYKNLRGIRIIRDIIPYKGPLVGIYSGLVASSSFYNFVVACDMPFLNQALISYMIKNRDDYDILIPKIEGKFHPLFGVYSKNCIPAIEEMLSEDTFRVSSIFPKVKSSFLLRHKIERFDRDLVSLVNINSLTDLKMIIGRHKSAALDYRD